MVDDESETDVVPGARRPAIPARAVTLSWRTSTGTSGSVRVVESCLLGSAASTAVVIEDPTVSRVHAELEIKPDGAWIRDLGSRNGTFVEGVRVGSAMLVSGARLRLGAVTATVTIELDAAGEAPWPTHRYGPLLASSAVMRSLFSRLEKAARTDATVLVLGETGTGKELVAQAIHDDSSRRGGAFVIVDCGAMHENLLESELFGHARGAFTGAAADRVGAFEAASGGTLFLDEIGELPLALQPKLLRALEARTVRRLGENRARPVDVRIIAATHRDLPKMVADGSFREDLYFRLAVLVVRVPPLRERAEDIALLARHFGGEEAFDAARLAELTTRRWPGNVRELRNHVERARAFGDETDDAGEIPPLPPPRGAEDLEQPLAVARAACVEAFERRYLDALLRRSQGNVTAAARAAGLDRTHLHRLLAKHGIQRRGQGDPD